jgi:glycosyltransferase involved in cell wall biosynthesis
MRRLVFFQHPAFLGSQSMPRFAAMLADAFSARGYDVATWAPRSRLHRRVSATRWAKWAGYVDQYLLFPRDVALRVRQEPGDTLFVFCDQALGPWVPLVANRPHVVHCHDLLALRGALGKIPENPTSWTGRIYQRYIRRGFRTGRHFVAVSNRTRDDMLTYGGISPETMEVVYNGLNSVYKPLVAGEARQLLRTSAMAAFADRPFILHVGGDQWYKNRPGLYRLYGAYAAAVTTPLPLVVVGPPSRVDLPTATETGSPAPDVRFVQGLRSEELAAAYSLARAFLFPSLAEGFGWPIAEAMACGCPVITTGEAPMTEVGGNVAFYLPRLRLGDEAAWSEQGARTLKAVLGLSDAERAALMDRGLAWVRRFDAGAVIDAYERIYQQVLAAAGHGPARLVQAG